MHRRTLTIIAAGLVLLSTGGCAFVGRSSETANGTGSGASAGDPTVSGDGTYVAFASAGPLLVPNDTNGVLDVFVKHHVTGAVERVSVSSAGVQANGGSRLPAIDASGRFVAFESDATNLVVGGGGVFVRDRLADTTVRVGPPGTGEPAISDDGRYIAFTSAVPIAAGDTNGVADVYVYDRLSQATTIVSLNSSEVLGNGPSQNPAISGDGRYVAWESPATNLVPNDTNGMSDVFRRDRQTGTTIRVSVSTFAAQGTLASSDASISDDGITVTFESQATNLASNDNNSVADVFVRRLTCSPSPCILPTTRVSLSTGGAEGDAGSFDPSISGDGRYVAFESMATNLASPGLVDTVDIFVRDRTTARTSTASTTLLLGAANRNSTEAAMSGDGRYVGFSSAAFNLDSDDTDGLFDVFLRAQPVPSVAGAFPSSAPAGATVSVTLLAANVLPTAQVFVTPGSITATLGTISATTVDVLFVIPASTPPGPVDIYLANPGTGPGTITGALGRCVACFTVT